MRRAWLEGVAGFDYCNRWNCCSRSRAGRVKQLHMWNECTCIFKWPRTNLSLWLFSMLLHKSYSTGVSFFNTLKDRLCTKADRHFYSGESFCRDRSEHKIHASIIKYAKTVFSAANIDCTDSSEIMRDWQISNCASIVCEIVKCCCMHTA